jgi:hypothetical protein
VFGFFPQGRPRFEALHFAAQFLVNDRDGRVFRRAVPVQKYPSTNSFTIVLVANLLDVLAQLLFEGCFADFDPVQVHFL